jgi:hypothetical protein
LGAYPIVAVACTSRTQTWHQGGAPSKNVGAFHLTKYSKTKYRGDSVYYYDPRPQDKRCTNVDEVNEFVSQLTTLKKPCMWLDVLFYQYKDYDIDEDRKNLLRGFSNDLVEGLKDEIMSAPDDNLSSDSSVHFGDTVSQSASEHWTNLRQIRVTASIFQDFVKYPIRITKKLLFQGRTDLSRVVAVQWGVDNEENALNTFAAEFGPIQKVGLFVSKLFPFLGASPDGLWKGHVLEVKCPYILREHHPLDIEKLTPGQRNAFCCQKVNGALKLKHSHKYFWQIQCQLFVTGATMAKFII